MGLGTGHTPLPSLRDIVRPCFCPPGAPASNGKEEGGAGEKGWRVWRR